MGAALRSGEIAETIASELTNEDFADPVTGKTFQAIKNLSDEGLDVSRISVSDRSGLSIAELEDLHKKGEGVTTSQLKSFITDIKRVSGLRAVYNACGQTTASISKDAKLEEVLESLEKGLYRLDKAGSQEARDGSEVLQNVASDFLKRFAEGGGPEVSTGLKALDKAIIGLRPGKMVVIAARPSMGKTALADTIRRAVVAQGYGAIQFSLEMSAEEILEREIANLANLNLRKVIAAKEVSNDELKRVSDLIGNGVNGLSGRWFIDDRTYSIAGIRRRSRILAGRMARQGIKLGCIILDYIQLAGENGEGREQSVAAISRGCKLMAKELGCTVLALSQLNRACESRDDKRPLMSDLRESGSIEQDADLVGFVYRDFMYNQEAAEDDAEFIIRKHRSGPTGTVRLKYNGKLVTFSDLESVTACPKPTIGTPFMVEQSGKIEQMPALFSSQNGDSSWRNSS